MTKLVKATSTPSGQGNDVFKSAHKRATHQLEQAFQKISGFKQGISSSIDGDGGLASKAQARRR